jgi:hypothetical protein
VEKKAVVVTESSHRSDVIIKVYANGDMLRGRGSHVSCPSIFFFFLFFYSTIKAQLIKYVIDVRREAHEVITRNFDFNSDGNHAYGLK